MEYPTNLKNHCELIEGSGDGISEIRDSNTYVFFCQDFFFLKRLYS